MSILGFHFNYKKAFTYSLLFSQSVWCFSLLMFGIQHLNFGFYPGNFKVLEILRFYGTCVIHDAIMASPLVSFILLVCNLRKRFLTLNNHLRYHQKRKNITSMWNFSFHCINNIYIILFWKPEINFSTKKMNWNRHS